MRPRLASLLFFTLALCCFASCGPASSGPRGGRPDVILILIDTLRADRLGAYGGPRPTSPNVDGLAADGARFERVVASSSVTSPSVASILTGRYPRFNSFGFGANGYRLVSSEQTIAEHFRDAGYRTAAIIGNPMLHPRAGFD